MQITQEDDYLYEGADLGILLLRGRLMSDDFQLSERANRWIKALKKQYVSDMLDMGALTEEELLLELEGGYKML
jgi:hypothetical protein